MKLLYNDWTWVEGWQYWLYYVRFLNTLSYLHLPVEIKQILYLPLSLKIVHMVEYFGSIKLNDFHMMNLDVYKIIFKCGHFIIVVMTYRRKLYFNLEFKKKISIIHHSNLFILINSLRTKCTDVWLWIFREISKTLHLFLWIVL